MRFFSIAALLVAMGAALAACSKENSQETQEQLPEVQKAGPFTLTTVVSRDESEVSKALTGDGVKTFAAGETLENQLAILAFTLKYSDGSATFQDAVETMTIEIGNTTYTIDHNPAGYDHTNNPPLYLAIRPVTTATHIDYTVTTAGDTYTKSVEGKTYLAGHLYPLGLKMQPVIE